MNVHRVLPWNPSAAADEPGGALYAPASASNRVSNPSLYREIYVASAPEAAVAEALGDLVVWRPATFVHPIGTLAMATYELHDDAPIFDLDDIDQLRALGITRPSRVVTPDRTATQAWARQIFESERYAGVRWWSHFNADWTALAIWNLDVLRVRDAPQPLRIDAPAVVDAARTIAKQRLR